MDVILLNYPKVTREYPGTKYLHDVVHELPTTGPPLFLDRDDYLSTDYKSHAKSSSLYDRQLYSDHAGTIADLTRSQGPIDFRYFTLTIDRKPGLRSIFIKLDLILTDRRYRSHRTMSTKSRSRRLSAFSSFRHVFRTIYRRSNASTVHQRHTT